MSLCQTCTLNVHQKGGIHPSYGNHSIEHKLVYFDGSSPSNMAKLCSIWTVDLAHLLASYGCNVSFFTVTVGANPEFAAERFYARNMAADTGRVDRLFNAAASAGISIRQCSVPWQDLRDIVIAGMAPPCHVAISAASNNGKIAMLLCPVMLYPQQPWSACRGLLTHCACRQMQTEVHR